MKNYEMKLLLNEKKEAIKKIHKYLENLDIGNEIHSVMEANEFSHQYLADIINCERSNIAKICKRKNNINLVQLVLISVALEHNFLEEVCDLLTPGGNKRPPTKFAGDHISTTVKTVCQTHQTPIIQFHQQE